MKSVKTKKIFVSALFALSLFFGISAATLMKNNSAAAEVSAAIEVVGAAVRYPEGAESAPKGTGLKFEVKLSNVAIESVVNLGVLVDKEGVPTTALTGDKHIKFIENSVASFENKYTVKDNDVYMYVSLVHVPKNYFHNEFVCRAYYQTETGDVVYSTNTLERSVTYVIKEAIADETGNAPTAEQKALLEKLRNASEDHTYTASYGEIVTPATDAAPGTRKAFCACGKEGVAPIGLYHYQFDTDGGIPVEGIDRSSYDTISELPTPERSGAEFLGWYNEAGEKVEKIVVPYAEGVTGKTVTLKAKWLVYLTEEELAAGYSFDGAGKIGRVKANSADTAISYDETKNAMAIAQGGSGESRLVRLSGSLTLNAGDRIFININNYNQYDGGVFRIMSKGNESVGGYNQIKCSGDTFFDYSWIADKAYEDVYIGYINFSTNAYYIKSIQLVEKSSSITVEELEKGVEFNGLKALSYFTAAESEIKVSYDTDKAAIKCVPVVNNKVVSINILPISLNKGDKIVVKVWCLLPSGTNASFVTTADGKKSYTNIYANTGFQEYAYTAAAECTVTDLQIALYTASGELYVQSIQIVRANAN